MLTSSRITNTHTAPIPTHFVLHWSQPHPAAVSRVHIYRHVRDVNLQLITLTDDTTYPINWSLSWYESHSNKTFVDDFQSVYLEI